MSRMTKVFAEPAIPQVMELSPNQQNLKEAAERYTSVEAELRRLHFLLRDTKQELVERCVKEGWIDLLTVSVPKVCGRINNLKASS